MIEIEVISSLSPNACKLYLILLLLQNNKIVYASTKQLISLTGFSRSTFHRTVNELLNFNIISKKNPFIHINVPMEQVKQNVSPVEQTITSNILDITTMRQNVPPVEHNVSPVKQIVPFPQDHSNDQDDYNDYDLDQETILSKFLYFYNQQGLVIDIDELKRIVKGHRIRDFVDIFDRMKKYKIKHPLSYIKKALNAQ